MLNTTTETKERKLYLNDEIAECALKASIATLKAIFYSTNDPKVGEMFFGLLADSQKINNTNIVDYTVSDGYDCFLVAYSFLLNEYNNGNNVDTLETRQRAKTGYHKVTNIINGVEVETKAYCTPIKIASKFYWMCSELRKYIYNNGQTDYKRMYVECQTDKDGKKESTDEATDRMLYQVGRYYDIDNERGVVVYEKLLAVCSDMTARQKLILHYRLQGKGTNEIAEILKVKHNTISSHLKAIQERVRKAYPEAVAVCIDRVAKAK